MAKELVKPAPRTFTALDWNDVHKWLNYKLRKDIRNYAGYTYKVGDDKPYLDFWQVYFCRGDDIHNGCFVSINFEEEQIAEEEGWVQEILMAIKEEFKEHIKDNYLEVWVWW